MQCEINRTTVSNGIKESASNTMKMSGLFNNEEDNFTPKSQDSNYQPVIEGINKSFGEQLVMRVDNPLGTPFFTIVEPSDRLVNLYLSTGGNKPQIITIRKDNKIITQYPDGVFKVEVDQDALEQHKKKAYETYEKNKKAIPKIIEDFKKNESKYRNNDNEFSRLVSETNRVRIDGNSPYFSYNKELQSFVYEEYNGDEQFADGGRDWDPKIYDKVVFRNEMEIGQTKTTEANILKQLEEANKKILEDTLGYADLWASQEGLDRYKGEIQYGYDNYEFGSKFEKDLLPEEFISPKLGYTLRRVSGGALSEIPGAQGNIFGYTYYHNRASNGKPDAHIFIDRLDETGVYIRYTTVTEDFRGRGIANLLLNRVRRDYPNLPIHRTLITNPIIVKQSAKIAGATDVDGKLLPKFKNDQEIYDWLDKNDHIILPPLNSNITISDDEMWRIPPKDLSEEKRTKVYDTLYNQYKNDMDYINERAKNDPEFEYEVQFEPESLTEQRLNEFRDFFNEQDYLNSQNDIFMSSSKKRSNIKSSTLSNEQNEIFQSLQKKGLIAEQSVEVNGRTYYKIPEFNGGRNFEAKDRLEQIIADKQINWINVIYGYENFLVELGEKEELPSYPDEPTVSPKALPITKTAIVKWLDRIGFRNIQTVNKLSYKGEAIEGSAYIDFANATLQIVEGTENYNLPEEAMHILVELAKESRPELYAEMKKNVVNYQVYREVLNDPIYTGQLYQNEDGSLNYDKIKDEAIAKLLVMNLTQELQGTESPARAATVYGWWKQLVDWIKSKFGIVKNPFKNALEPILNDDVTFGEFADISSDDIFFSAKSVDQIDKENPDSKAIFDAIKSRPQQMGIYKVGSEYFKDGQKIDEGQRVSALTSEYYTKLFGDRNFDEALEAFYERSRQDGTFIHEVMEEIINSYIDPQTGLMRKNPARLTFPLANNPINVKMSKELQIFMRGFMAQYPTGTRFITEQIIYDPSAKNKDGSIGRFGTVDFIAILPDGKVDIIDWKSMLLQDLEGAKDYKREGIFIQLNEYKRILKSQYGANEFGKIRAIPIKKVYKTFPSGNKALTAIHVGSPNASEIPIDEKYLRPIISPQESTGSESRDEIVTKLEALYQKYIDKGYFQKDRNILNDVQEAIYEIRTSNSVDNLSNYFIDLRTKFIQLLGEEKALLESNSKNDISESLAMISFYEDIIENVVEPSVFLQEDKTIDKESRNKLYKSASDLNFLLRKLRVMRANLLDTQAQKAGIFNLLTPEKVVNLARRIFRSMGSQNIASVRYMYEMVKKSYNRIDLETDKLLTNLKDHKAAFESWKKTNRKSDKEAIGMLVDFDKAKIHSKIDKSFYEERDKIIEEKKPASIIAFVKKNYDLTAYNEWYEKTLAQNQKIWEASTYDLDPKKNAQIIKNRIKTFETNYNIFTNPITAYGFHNTLIWSRNIKEDNWYSSHYKELLKPENRALLDMYNFMVDRNKELAETGAIRDYEQYTFIPKVQKTLADHLSFDDKDFIHKSKDIAMQSLDNWRRNLSVEGYELNYQGARDPFTGEKLEKRFVPYINRLPKDKMSFDIFTMYGLMSKEIMKEKYLSENDEVLRALVHIEKAKPNLLQNKYGTVATDSNGKPLESKEVGRNSPILEEHVRAVVNGESLQYDADYVINFKLREKWNKTPLGKLYQFDTNPETYNPTSISATKFLLWLNTANQKRILGINAASAISNLFGGSFSSSKLYQKYISKDDLQASWLKMTSGGFYQSEAMKKNAALVDYFLPLLQNREAFKSSQLSVNEAAKILSQEWLMAPMRKTSETVQLNIFLALIENTAVIDGRLVNVREKAAEDTNYLNRYSVPTNERGDIEKKFNERIKELKDKFGLLKVAQFKKETVGGKEKVVIDIPGISRDGKDVEELREISQTMAKDSLGEADEFDVANYKYSIWWRLFMTFKNWIPRMADVRYGEFRYDQAHHSYEYGRFRMFARSISVNYVLAAAKIIPIPYITGKITQSFGKESLIARAKEVYLEKMEQAKVIGTYNKDTFISEGEFIDRFIQGTEATYAELRTMILMSALLFVGLAAPDDDDDASDKAYKALIRKQMNKLIDEVGFFYSPKSGIDIAGGGAPVFSLVRDSWYLGSDITQQFFGFTFEQLGIEKGEDMQEKAKPIKRAFKVLPVLKEILTYLPVVDEETAKDWGVKVSDRRAY